jgi:ribosomal-protein-alanine N-acetyltransferase
VTLRPATPADLASISAIQQASPEASQWDPASYLAHACTVAEIGGTVAGFLVSRETTPGEHEILNLAVDPALRRLGVARGLLNHHVASGLGRWFLEVRASSTAAIRLYESVGFRRSGRRENYYSNPSEPAIVMQWDS